MPDITFGNTDKNSRIGFMPGPRPRVLMIEDNPIYRRTVHDALGEHFDVFDAETGEAGLKSVQLAKPDCILLDYLLPDTDGLELLGCFVAREIPVIMLTGEGNEDVAVEAMRTGAHDYLIKGNVTAKSLQQAVIGALGSSPAKQDKTSSKTVLLIEDDEVDRRRVQRYVARKYQVAEAELGAEGLGTFLQQRPDCVLLDYSLPDVYGLDLLDDLVRHDATVVMLTGHGNEQIAVDAMKHGAHDYLTKDNLDAESLRRAIDNAVETSAMRQKIREQQDQLKRHAEQLQRSNHELQQFAYVASHDLQEPLRSVSSFCNLLQEEYKGQFDERADRWMGKIVRGAERMKTMIQDLLAYSRVESCGAEFQPTDCQKVFNNVKADLAGAIRNAAAVVTSDQLPRLIADESQIIQLLQNLIGNAIKYCRADTPVVHVAARRDGDWWTFSIEDNGIGIEPEHFERIFQMFKRLHTRDQYPGTGIGLALCHRIVHRHGGRIWVESEAGQGSTFFFTIPATSTLEQDHESPALAAGAC